MSIPEAIRAVAVEYMATVPGLWIRTSRNQFKDMPANVQPGGVAFPQLYISATPKYYENVNATWNIDLTFDISTHMDDDPEGRQNAYIEAALEKFLDAIFAFLGGTDEQARFVAIVQETLPTFCLGACYCDSAPSTASTSDNITTLSQTFTLHFSY